MNLNALDALLAPLPNTAVTIVNPAGESGVARLLHESLKAAGIEVFVTLGRRGQLLGGVLLGPRRNGDAYFKNDLAFVEFARINAEGGASADCCCYFQPDS